jgi:hypothetical protein
MTRYWALGLFVAAAAVIYLVRRLRDSAGRRAQVDIPLWEAPRIRPEFPLDAAEALDDDTAPAVLSPPEWKPPRAA